MICGPEGRRVARPRSRGTRKLDNVRWTFSSGFFSAVSAGDQALGFFTAQTLPETLMRIRGSVAAWLDNFDAPPVGIIIQMGIIKVPEGTGTTVVYSPASDANAPWLWYSSALLAYEEKVTDVIDVPGMTAQRFDVDNKAMRRIRPDEELQIVMSNTTLGGGGAGDVNVAYGLRSLIGF